MDKIQHETVVPTGREMKGVAFHSAPLSAVVPMGREMNGVSLPFTPALRIFVGNPDRAQGSL